MREEGAYQSGWKRLSDWGRLSGEQPKMISERLWGARKITQSLEGHSEDSGF